MATYLIDPDGPKPQDWQGTHYLNCRHQFNEKSVIRYQMFCNVLHTMPDGRLKIEVFGDRYKINGENLKKRRIRYVDARKVTQDLRQ